MNEIPKLLPIQEVLKRLREENNIDYYPSKRIRQFRGRSEIQLPRPAAIAPPDPEDEYLASRNIRTKGVWSRVEDKELLKLVRKHGAKDWAMIAAVVGTKSPKQCRDRWHNQLNPTISNEPWTKREDEMLLQANRDLGNRWSKIATIFPGRTPNAIKNHFNSSLRFKKFT